MKEHNIMGTNKSRPDGVIMLDSPNRNIAAENALDEAVKARNIHNFYSG